MTISVKEMQSTLSHLGLYTGQTDGDWGPRTMAAAGAYLDFRHVAKDREAWGPARVKVALEQAIMLSLGIDAGDVDGRLGPQTLAARDAWDSRFGGSLAPELWRDSTKPATIPLPPAATKWPTQREVPKFFGDIGTNQTQISVPYEMRLAWDTAKKVSMITCHKLVAGVVTTALSEVVHHYGEARIKELRLDLFGGCLNVRKMRGGSAWSMHSWGIALDFDPERNQLRMNHTKASFAKSEYTPWWEIWESVGGVSLGRTSDYDWMHVQFARL